MNEHYKFENPPLPYAYDAMEPYIDTKTMEIHHDKHLQTYIDNLNKVLEDYPQYQHLSLDELIKHANMLPEDIKTPIINNAGGVYNHLFYFSNLANPSTVEPTGMVAEYINDYFGTYEAFKEEFTKAALSVFGSGYAWLTIDKDNQMKIITTANQDNPLSYHLFPILNIDVWEHAYYLKHYNVRADYIKDWFQVINWDSVNQHFNIYLDWEKLS